MATPAPQPQPQPQPPSAMAGLTARMCDMAAAEINKPETQAKLKERIIHPLVGMIYAELYPYIMAAIIVIVSMLLLSLLSVLLLVWISVKAARLLHHR